MFLFIAIAVAVTASIVAATIVVTIAILATADESKPPRLYASSIRSNDSAEIRTPLPKAMMAAINRWEIGRSNPMLLR